jgi:hypothetical protein
MQKPRCDTEEASMRNPVPNLPTEVPDPRRLHEATDRLNKVLAEFEKALAELKLGVSARVILDSNTDGWYKVLSFTKTGGGFKLVVETGFDQDPEGADVTPLASASRETRLEAVENLPKLYKNLLKAFEEEIVRVNESIDQVEDLARLIRAEARK